MADINIKSVAKYYAELPHQNIGLEMLQQQLVKQGLVDENEAWVIEYRKAEKPEVKLELPVSKAAVESQILPFTGIVNWSNMRSRVSKYFTVYDVLQGDVRRMPTDPKHVKNILALGRELDLVREAWNAPILVSSWHRPLLINRAVGGVDGSRHIQGLAADIYNITNGSIYDFQKWLDARWGGRLGYGAKKNFVHLDIDGGGGLDKLGSNGKVRWNY